MVPMVNTPDEARRVVEASHFPPLGRRSYGGRRVVDLGGRQYCYEANDDVLVIAQIETREAVANAGAIAAIDGVDVIFFSPDDLKLDMGLEIDTPVTDPALAECFQAVARAAAEAGAVSGGIATDASTLEYFLAAGYRLICGGADAAFLRAASRAALAELRDTAARALGG
jgi:4-hydroxy-2-oxoheptanedioate aldolase